MKYKNRGKVDLMMGADLIMYVRNYKLDKRRANGEDV